MTCVEPPTKYPFMSSPAHSLSHISPGQHAKSTPLAGTEHAAADDESMADIVVRRKKARRAPRKNKRQWRPYSQLTWEERRQLELGSQLDKETSQQQYQSNPTAIPQLTDEQQPQPPQPSASEGAPRRRRKHRSGREQPPPAPRNTTQFLALQHADPAHQSTSHAASPAVPPAGGNTDFAKAYDECMYESLSKDELLEYVRRQEQEIEQLRSQLVARKGGASAMSATSEPSHPKYGQLDSSTTDTGSDVSSVHDSSDSSDSSHDTTDDGDVNDDDDVGDMEFF